jgi:PST family polysaccharide transporter
VFRILSVTGPAQVLLESTVWVLVSRGQSDRLLRLWLFVSPVIIGSFALGLPFGIKGVALSYSIVFLAILPSILRFTFKETQLTLESLGEVLRYPILVSVAGALCASLASHWLIPTTLLSQFVVLSAGFATGCLLATLLHPVRHEIMTFRELFAELRP